MVIEEHNNHETVNTQALLSNQFSRMKILVYIKFLSSWVFCSICVVEYPYVIPQPAENIPLSSPPAPLSPGSPVETVTNLTKTMKLNAQKSVDGPGCRSKINSSTNLINIHSFSLLPESFTPTSTSDKTFDTNTFVLKKKERRKMPTPATETSLNTVETLLHSAKELCSTLSFLQTSEVPSAAADLPSKQYPFNTPSTSLDTAVASRPATSQQQQQQPLLMDPTRIM